MGAQALVGAAEVTLAVLPGIVAGFGWTYALRGLGWLDAGPGVPDSLPLLQLAGFDAQPLARLIVAWLLAGVIVGLLLAQRPRLRRSLLTAALSLIVLLVLSQAADALARNLRFSAVLWHRSPGAGPWVQALLLGAGSALPRPALSRLRKLGRRLG